MTFNESFNDHGMCWQGMAWERCSRYKSEHFLRPKAPCLGKVMLVWGRGGVIFKARTMSEVHVELTLKTEKT